jgi:cob(I)alamin adenosyltransferase
MPDNSALRKQPVADRGLFIIFTGNGKGKTTAALGQAIRAAGHGLRVCIIQFVKSMKNTGEAKALHDFGHGIEVHICGSGFTWESPREKVAAAAAAGWQLSREKILSGAFDMIILDEITYLLNHAILDTAAVLKLIKSRPPALHIIITGRDAADDLVAAADLVTEMKEIKHPYQNGGKARKGIEY